VQTYVIKSNMLTSQSKSHIMKLKCKIRNITSSNVLFLTMTSTRQLNVWTVYF